MTVVPTEVAVGVLIRPDGSFLIAQRPAGKPMAGYWEFPGGKLEPGESVFEALRREFIEELGLTITQAVPWAQRVVVYPHATVRLHFWRAYAWQGEPQSLEGQAWCWEHIDALTAEPWLAGALPLRRWLALFHVTPCPQAESVLRTIAAQRGLACDFIPLYRGYAFLAALRRDAKGG